MPMANIRPRMPMGQPPQGKYHMFRWKRLFSFILVRGGQQQFKLTNTVRNVPSIDNGMVGMVQPAPQAPIPTADGQEPLTSSMLAAANPQEQKQMLGERLFPLIQVRVYRTRKRNNWMIFSKWLHLIWQVKSLVCCWKLIIRNCCICWTIKNC